jgi:hypothetical protein
MTDPTATPTLTETLRERVRGALATVPLGEDDVHVFYVAEKHLDRLTDAVLAAVSAAAPDEREARDGQRLPERFRFSREVYGDVADDATRVLLALTDGGHADQPSDHLRWVSITAAQALDARPARGERATDPLIVSAIRRHPSGTLRYEPANGPATGTSGRSFLAEYDAALAARPAPVVSGADVERAAAVLLADYQQQYDGGQIEEFLDLARAVARALGLTVADEGRAEDRIEREGGGE